MKVPSTANHVLAKSGVQYPFEIIFLSLLSIFILGVTCLLILGESRTQFPNDDIIVYSVVAKLWGQGLLPYRDVADHKPPFIYVFYRLCFWIGGASPKSLYQGYTLITGLISVGMIFSFYRISRPYLGVLVGFAYAFFFLTDPLALGQPAFLNTELLASAFLATTLGILVVYRSKRSSWLAGLAGVTFGCAVMSKQPSLVFGLACLAHLVSSHWERVSWRSAIDLLRSGVCFCIGALVPLLGCVAYFAINNALSDAVFFVHHFNMAYSGMGSPFSALRLAILHEHITSISNHLKQPTALPYLLAVLVVPVLAVVRRSWIDFISLAWLISSIGCTALNMQGPHSHYHVFYQVPLALAAAVVIEAVISIIRAGKFLKYTLMICLICLVFSTDLFKIRAAVNRYRALGPVASDDYGATQIRKSMMKLAALAGENRQIFFYSPSPLALFYTELVPVSKYIYNIPFTNVEERERQRLEAFKKFEPKVAIISNYSPSGELGQYVQENYIRQEDGTSFVRKK